MSYVRRHPEEVLRALRNAIGLRFGVPIVALRFLAANLDGKRAPKDVEISAVPPGIRVGATLDLMGTTVRASAVVVIEALKLDAETLRIEIRLRDVALKALDERQETPIAALLKSGALDLSKPGNLAAYMPKRPALLVEARDDRIVLDFMKHPKLANDARLKRALYALAPMVTVAAIESDPDHLDVALRALPDGLSEVVAGLRRAFS
ncbi:MAG TPA: hypothetical protein VMI54_03910 [Polyangiaceae bacterium]|nr:hypothetical protein [Polyangiaceae bacterium]